MSVSNGSGRRKSPNVSESALNDQIAANAMRFYEYYNDEMDTLINGCVVGELTYREPTREHCVTMKRVMDQHIMHLASTGQSMHEIIEFLISLASIGCHNSQDDRFGLFNSSSINVLLSQMVNINYVIHSLDGYSDNDGENLLICLLKHVDRTHTKIMVQMLDSCIALINTNVSSLLSSMSPQSTVDGRTVSAVIHPSRVFKCYNWIANWAYGKYSGNTSASSTGPIFWMKPEIYRISVNLLSLRSANDEIGLCKQLRTRIQRTLEYYFNPFQMHISATLAPHLTYYNQWVFNNRLCEQLRRLMIMLVNNSKHIKEAHDIVARHNIKYTGVSTIANHGYDHSTTYNRQSDPVSFVSSGRQRQVSVPTSALSVDKTSTTTSHSPSTSDAMALSTGSMNMISIPHKKTLVIMDGRNMFYKPNSPMTHNINLTMMKEFLNHDGQCTLYQILAQCIYERFGVSISEHEYQQFHIVVIFHERHRKTLESCFPRDPITGVRGPPQNQDITYVYTPGNINDDIVAIYLWLSNPGTILLTNDDYSNYAHNIHGKNAYLYTLLREWLHLFRVSRDDYIKRANVIASQTVT